MYRKHLCIFALCKDKDKGILKYDIIHSRWNDHISGKRNWGPQLWSVLVFQQWLKSQENL